MQCSFCFITPVIELDPKDVVEVFVGQRTSACMRLREMLSNQVRADQAFLTSETNSMEKEITTTIKVEYQDKMNILCMEVGPNITMCNMHGPLLQMKGIVQHKLVKISQQRLQEVKQQPNTLTKKLQNSALQSCYRISAYDASYFKSDVHSCDSCLDYTGPRKVDAAHAV
ncbi:hypothetical protein VNO77_33859 [Canavalia gladiata]|uniref:Uncharacterized protein n=1 Tax=Canavalia gladiata TaxID=3824 RepID=A0AAN9PZB2_CANGL